MGLFSNKPPCIICGGKIPMILSSKIEDEYVCSDCYNKIDMENDMKFKLTIQDFREYLSFFDQNQKLKDKFAASVRIDFGLMDTKMTFDYQNRLFCMSKNLDKTVFEGKHVKSFIIKEDETPLFEGSAEGILHYPSTVPDRVMTLLPQIKLFERNREMARVLDRLDDRNPNHSAALEHLDLPEPFKAFNVELYFEHPYWKMIKCDMNGPRFNNTNPDVNHYLRSYQQNMEEIEKLVYALRKVSFPYAAEHTVRAAAAQKAPVRVSSPTNTIEEIRQYKALMEEGIITPQEYEKKKRQILEL